MSVSGACSADYTTPYLVQQEQPERRAQSCELRGDPAEPTQRIRWSAGLNFNTKCLTATQKQELAPDWELLGPPRNL